MNCSFCTNIHVEPQAVQSVLVAEYSLRSCEKARGSVKSVWRVLSMSCDPGSAQSHRHGCRATDRTNAGKQTRQCYLLQHTPAGVGNGILAKPRLADLACIGFETAPHGYF